LLVEHKLGSTICRNNWRVRQDKLDEKVLRIRRRRSKGRRQKGVS
jgi:hypothetical protein